MSTVTVTGTVPLPKAEAWKILADFGGIYRFHPRVAKSPILGELAEGLGATRRCEFHDGNHVVETVTGFEEGEAMEIKIIEGTMPLACAEARIELRPLGAGTTEVSFSMNYAPKYGVVGQVMDRLMMRRMFRKILGEVLDGLADYAGQRPAAA